ncbi:MAG: hypothetical protein JWP56_2188 [Aeromicrobium sp.]|nr:hypothetical protein [Aeromicrobium sp.]
MTFGKRLAAISAMAMGFVALSGPAAQATYYSEYDDVASTPDTAKCTAAQGFAAGSTYLYSIKTRTSDYGRSVIYRVNKDTKKTQVMTTGGKSYNGWLGHANDMTIADFAGKHYFWVATYNKSSSKAQLVQLSYSGNTYKKVKSYHVKLSGKIAAVTGITRAATTDTGINFFFKSEKQVYTGTVKLKPSQKSSTVNIKKAFKLSTANAKVNGQKIDLSGFLNQGFHYDPAKSVVYYPLTKGNRSVVLVYPGVVPTRDKAAYPSETDSFRITSSKYSKKFEIEGLGLSGGKLYFNTNRATTKKAADGVHVFKGYTS